MLESIQKLYDSDQLNKKIESFEDPQQWRDLKYWNTKHNIFINENMTVLRELYNKSLALR